MSQLFFCGELTGRLLDICDELTLDCKRSDICCFKYKWCNWAKCSQLYDIFAS